MVVGRRFNPLYRPERAMDSTPWRRPEAASFSHARVRDESSLHFAGRPMGRIQLQQLGPALRGLRPIVSIGRRGAQDLARWRFRAAVARRWQGTVLPVSGRVDDG